MYVPDCDNCPHYYECAVKKELPDVRETLWNMGRAAAGRSDYFLNGKYYPPKEEHDGT